MTEEAGTASKTAQPIVIVSNHTNLFFNGTGGNGTDPSTSDGRYRAQEYDISNPHLSEVTRTHVSEPQSSGGTGQLLKIAGVGLVAAVAAPAAVGTIVSVAGFKAGGVAAGSAAAAWQSSVGAIATGSLFSTLQSVGAAGIAKSTALAVGAGASAVAASFGLKDNRISQAAEGKEDLSLSEVANESLEVSENTTRKTGFGLRGMLHLGVGPVSAAWQMGSSAVGSSFGFCRNIGVAGVGVAGSAVSNIGSKVVGYSYAGFQNAVSTFQSFRATNTNVAKEDVIKVETSAVPAVFSEGAGDQGEKLNSPNLKSNL